MNSFLRLMTYGLVLLLAACQPPDEVVVSIKGKQHRRTPTQLAQGRLTPELQDADYALVSDMAMLSAVVYAGVRAPHHRPDYRQDTAKFALEQHELARRGWQRFPLPTRWLLPGAN